MSEKMTVRQSAQQADIPPQCSSCEARRHGLCATFDAGQLARIVKASSRLEFPAGTELPTRDVYLSILSGVVKITKSISSDRLQIVGLHFAPDFLGSPIDTGTADEATAATNVLLCSFPKEVVESVWKTSPRLNGRFLRQMQEKLDEARYWITTLGRKTASEKVASFLLMVVNNSGYADDRTGSAENLELPLTRGEIADFLGLTISTVSRELMQLQADGVIRVSARRGIGIYDMRRLESLSGDSHAFGWPHAGQEFVSSLQLPLPSDGIYRLDHKVRLTRVSSTDKTRRH